MKKLAIVAVALGSLATFASGAAHADPPDGPSGFLCGFGSSDDPTGTIANPGTQVGELDGGPLALTDTPANFTPTVIDVPEPDPANPTGSLPSVTPGTVEPDPSDNGNPVSGTLTCALQVGGTGAYTEPDAVSASASGIGVIYLPPSLISYQAGATDPVWVTTTVQVVGANGDGSATYYYDYASGDWTTDESAAQGDLAISQQVPPQEVCDAAPPVCAVP
jgi:hypothetical protein